MKKRIKCWQIAITEALDEVLDRALRENTHVSKSDYIREAVREKLTRDGYLPLRIASSKPDYQFETKTSRVVRSADVEDSSEFGGL